MKKYKLFLLFNMVLILFNRPLPGQSIPIDSIYNTIRNRSVHTNEVNWAMADSAFRSTLQEATSVDDTLKSFIEIFKAMDDVHSSIQYDQKIYNYYHAVDEVTSQMIQPLLLKMRMEAGVIRVALIDEQYAYIQVPAIFGYGDVINTYAQAIHDSICTFQHKKITGYIIDLRLNGGGNMYPMLGGLSCFFDNQPIGSVRDRDNNILFYWTIRDHQFCFETPDERIFPLSNYNSSCQPDYSKMPVVILLSAGTASSGQATAIAFKQRPNTFFIGEASAEGYTTGNDYFTFNNGISMNLSTAWNADRNGNIYYKQVLPDQVISGGDNFDVLMNDAKIKAAILWLNNE